MSDFISYKGFHWEYETFGNGKEYLLAFHGFGNHSSDFKVLEKSLGKNFSIISFNLPYHGNSTIDANKPDKTISKNDLKELFQLFLNQKSIDKFSLMGYSLGGKIVLQLIELFPGKVNSVFLFAPDGIKTSWSSGFVTRNKAGKMMYRRIIHDPSRFFRFVKMLKDLNLMHEKLSEFLHNSLSTAEKRQQVWDVWMCFRDIIPDIKKIQNIINRNEIPIHLFFGKYDRIIPPSIGESFTRGLNNKSSLHVIEMGHVMIKEKMNDFLLPTLT